MIESEARGLAVIQRNIGDAGKMLVARTERRARQCRIGRECQPGSGLQRRAAAAGGIFLDQIVTMAMTDDEIKVAFL